MVRDRSQSGFCPIPSCKHPIFTSDAGLLQHLLGVHLEQWEMFQTDPRFSTLLECHLCQKVYPQNRNGQTSLRNHYREVHQGEGVSKASSIGLKECAQHMLTGKVVRILTRPTSRRAKKPFKDAPHPPALDSKLRNVDQARLIIQFTESCKPCRRGIGHHSVSDLRAWHPGGALAAKYDRQCPVPGCGLWYSRAKLLHKHLKKCHPDFEFGLDQQLQPLRLDSDSGSDTSSVIGKAVTDSLDYIVNSDSECSVNCLQQSLDSRADSGTPASIPIVDED